MCCMKIVGRHVDQAVEVIDERVGDLLLGRVTELCLRPLARSRHQRAWRGGDRGRERVRVGLTPHYARPDDVEGQPGFDGGAVAADHQVEGVDDLGQIVGRDVGGHTDGDADRAVDEEVRQLGGQDGRLAEGAVEVGREVDGVLVEVGQ